MPEIIFSSWMNGSWLPESDSKLRIVSLEHKPVITRKWPELREIQEMERGRGDDVIQSLEELGPCWKTDTTSLQGLR